MSTFINTHPGELLQEDFLKPMGITAYRLAKDTRIPQTRISEILHLRRGITPDTDLRLSAFFGLSAGYWLKAQTAYDIREAKHKLAARVKREVKPFQPAKAA